MFPRALVVAPRFSSRGYPCYVNDQLKTKVAERFEVRFESGVKPPDQGLDWGWITILAKCSDAGRILDQQDK